MSGLEAMLVWQTSEGKAMQGKQLRVGRLGRTQGRATRTSSSVEARWRPLTTYSQGLLCSMHFFLIRLYV